MLSSKWVINLKFWIIILIEPWCRWENTVRKQREAKEIYRYYLPSTKHPSLETLDKHWHILSINENLQKAFGKKPFIAYRRNTNLYQLIGGNHIFKNKVVLKSSVYDSRFPYVCLSLLGSSQGPAIHKIILLVLFRLAGIPY